MPIGVLLLANTPEPDRTVAAAARLCYSDISAVEIAEGLRKRMYPDLSAT